MSPTYDSSGAQRSEKNDPTKGGRSFRDVQKAKRANAKEPKPTSSPSAKGVRPTVKSCTVCSSPYRDDIEKLHAYGMSQADIIKHFAQFDEQYHLSKGSLSNHLTKHVTLMDQAYRRMLDKEAQKRFDNIEEVADNLLTNRAMLEVMRQKAYNAIVDESVEIEPETALKIIDKLAADDARQSQEKIDEMVMEMNLLIRTIKQVVPESMWTKIAEQYKTVLEIERDKRRMIERGQ